MDTLYEVAYNILKNSRLFEMAISRSDLERILHPQIEHTFKHFVKIKCLPNDPAVNHWKGEIKGAFGRFQQMRYSYNNKRPTPEQWMGHVTHNSLFEPTAYAAKQIVSDLREDDEYNIQNLTEEEAIVLEKQYNELLVRMFSKINKQQLITIEDV